jgi:hypothetical protein
MNYFHVDFSLSGFKYKKSAVGGLRFKYEGDYPSSRSRY